MRVFSIYRALSITLSCVFVIATFSTVHASPSKTTAAAWSGFPSGVMCAGVETSSLLLWTRTKQAGELVFSVQGPADKAPRKLKAYAHARTGYTATVTVDDLQPSTVYQWSVSLSDGTTSPSASCKTAPPRGDGAPVTFLVSGDVAAHRRVLQQDRFSIFEPMRAHNADFFISLGDWPYADNSKDLKDLRETYARHRKDPRLLAFLAQTGVYATFDDHEVTNDWGGQTRIDDADLVRRSLRVWSEWFPRRRAEGEPETSFYRSFVWGELEFFFLDTRSLRDSVKRLDSLDPEGKPRKSMLGERQRTWLLRALHASQARFKIILSSVPLDFGTTGADHWTGYRHERDLILKTIERDAISGVVFLTADQHWYSANHYPEGLKEFQFGPLTATVRHPGTPRHETVRVVESRNYGRIVYDPSAKTLRVEGRDARGELLDVEVLTSETGVLDVSSNTDAEVRLCVQTRRELERTCGHAFRAIGAARYIRAPVGRYTVSWGEVPGHVRPKDQVVEVRPDRETRVRGAYVRTPHALPWSRSFRKASWDGLRVVDEGASWRGAKAPGWVFKRMSLVETTGYGRERVRDALGPRGTFIVAGDDQWTDVEVRADVLPMDDDTVGLVVRYESLTQYIRLEIDRQSRQARAVRCDGGTCTVIKKVSAAYRKGKWMSLRAELRGEEIVFFDGPRVLLKTRVEGSTRGAAGIYSRSSQGTFFREISVRALSAP